ncbi:MAG: tRNA (guanosine(37)-N1)-methyltransferase TrmD [Elusimicrobia bacterium]|nr:tRNA (guanosine(37)-N1)-methyltransferase TrmD [Elusimicrobiota bacterium]
MPHHLQFEVLTLFPDIFQGFLQASLIGKAMEKGLIGVRLHNIRDFCRDKHRQADDKPYGGGPGMVLMAEPVYQALQFAKNQKPKLKYGAFILSPRGVPLTTELAKKLSKYDQLILLAGHYEGIDERVSGYFDGEISVGDYVTMGGEVPAMIVIEAVSRFIPGVVKEKASVEEDSFSIRPPPSTPHPPPPALLEWPQYTRPAVWRGRKIPKILLSGHHAQIRSWRLKKALEKTCQKFPEGISEVLSLKLEA